MTGVERRALVFGATGFLGRWLVVELVSQQVPVVAAVRSASSGERLRTWLRAHGVVVDVETVDVDFSADDLGLDVAALDGVTEIHNLAGAYRFGMSAEQAREANVVTARRIVTLASRLAGPPRLVHVSGYRVGSHGPPAERDARGEDPYRRLGAYEASKIEADAVVQQTAAELGVPFTIVNPSTVSGVSTTGEADQYLGLAASLRDLWRGSLTALPGGAETFVPVVTVDHFARFMALVPTVADAAGKSYWVLDEDTPGLPDLLKLVGDHYQVRVPGLRIPVALVKRLPGRLTKADPETLSFLDTARYPTAAADALAAAHGLEQPATVPSILRWADHLAAHRFGAVAPGGPARSFTSYDRVRTFGVGDRDAATLVLPGLPFNADTWAEVVARAAEPARAVDLPGLGMSAGDERRWRPWLEAVVGDRSGVHLVGHSIGAALALELAAADPTRVARLTLVAPAFLQDAPGLLLRLPAVTAAFLRTADAQGLARRLLGAEDLGERLETSVADLRRPGVARRAARLVARGGRADRRSALRRLLEDYPGEVHVIVGEHDPLASDAALPDRFRVSRIDGAGHHPHLTHPARLAGLLGQASLRG